MKNIIKLILLSLIISVNADAQPITWMRYYSPTGFINKGIDVVENYDTTYVLVSNTSDGTCLIKTSKYGQIIWQKFLGDSLGTTSQAMEQTKDSGFVITGESIDLYHALQVIKTDKNGDIQWVKRYNRTGMISRAWSVKITKDNGFIFGGNIYSSQTGFKAYAVKTDSLGTFQWDKIYNSSQGIYDIIQLTNGNFYTVDFNIFRMIDSLGNENWTIPVGGAVKILQSENGYLYLGGGTGHFYLAKSDTSGKMVFQKNYLTQAYCSGMCLTKDSNILLAGSININGLNVAYLKVTLNGDTLFSKFINLLENTNESISNVRSTIDNGFIMIGTTDYPAGSDFYDNILAIKTDSSGNTSSIVSVKNNYQNMAADFYLYQNYPNPFNPVTTLRYSLNTKSHIKLFISDVTGKIVASLVNKEQLSGDYKYYFDGTKLSSGIYFIILQNETSQSIKKMMLIK